MCIKQKNLEKMGYKDITDWCNTENNLYVARDWRICMFELDRTANKKIRVGTKVLKASKWKNPFSLNEYDLKKTSLILYV